MRPDESALNRGKFDGKRVGAHQLEDDAAHGGSVLLDVKVNVLGGKDGKARSACGPGEARARLVTRVRQGG